MGEATLGGLSFRLDPHAIQWSYTLKTSVKETVGGKVVQVFGVSPGDLVVRGALGTAGVEGHMRFIGNLQYLAEQQAEDLDPIEFTFPQRGWRFEVYIKSVSSPDSTQGVRVSPDIANPKFTLTLNVVSENANLQEVAANKFIANLTEGIGWIPNEYNGVVDYDSLGRLIAGEAKPATAIQADTSGGTTSNLRGLLSGGSP